jgi:sugar phosphate isomerase/epimerase
MQDQPASRRDFLKTGSALAAALLAGNPLTLLAASEYGGNKIPFGVQLYPVRKECAKDLPGTLTALAGMGFQAVEFADYFNHDAKALRKMLDDAGLKCCGTHIYLDTMLGDELPKTIEFSQTLGNQSLVIRWLPEKYTANRQAYEHAADLASEVAAKLKPHGMHVCYHNHDTDFKPLNGELPWDIFFTRADKAVLIQLDTGNAAAGGADPVACIKKFPGRVVSLHVKPFSKARPNAIIGDDELPWKEIFNLCETSGGTRLYIIEYEKDLYPPLEADRKSLEVMRRWGKC